MRVTLCVLAVAGVGAFLAYRHKQETPAVVVEQQPTQVQLTNAPPQQNSPHDWMKNSLDRAADVKRQVSQQRKEDGVYGR